ncbi:L-arabinose isomerase [Halobacterium sp. KA-4]|uniref:L-arabinose isomerase n=1 Tax=Halobacterium sp. KA-4 TaxID=2896367 RepID=UPI001E4C2427|nr:L-arabinose isomerase [Halobacterium sp. KA-4]MCD2201456.1 L-arabinose isomerase [Halobacterium sp. KA-4]
MGSALSIMSMFPDTEIWFITGSQHLYGEKVIETVENHAEEIATFLSDSESIPVDIIPKSVVASESDIWDVCQKANASDECIGLVIWMHTFSPGQMWIRGLNSLNKPFVHFHTQYNRDLPWEEIDMDFMNTNQSAHGGREFGYTTTRMGLKRKVVVGHWTNESVQTELGRWARAACALAGIQGAKIARFGDNMREVAVTEGDKVSAKMRFGCTVSGYGLGDLVEYVDAVSEEDIDALVTKYESNYELATPLQAGNEKHESLREAAAIELGLRAFLEEGNFNAFTTNFQNLTGLTQLPGLAVQRLMADGYGFGPEGDWKSALLTRAMKIMGSGLEGGTSLMEHYTYHLTPGEEKVLGSHMLEVCESIADGTPCLEIHPLDIGGKDDPVRAVFDTAPGSAVNASLVDMGDRFRIVANTVEVVEPDAELRELPVACAIWEPDPDFETAIESWIRAGGAHHTGFSQSVSADHLRDFARMAGLEFLLIDEETDAASFETELKYSEAFHKLSE